MGDVRNVGADVGRVVVIVHWTTRLRSVSNHRKRRSAEGVRVHSHPEIVKEDAFFRLDTVSSTRGQVKLRLRFPEIEEDHSDFGKQRKEL